MDMPRMPAAIDPQVDEMRGRNEQATASHKDAVGEQRAVVQEGHAQHQQHEPWQSQYQRQPPTMAAKARHQGCRGKHAGEGHEDFFEPMVGEET